jgi:hypothetical protein
MTHEKPSVKSFAKHLVVMVYEQKRAPGFHQENIWRFNSSGMSDI